jgi:hypothetical protein
MRKRDTPALQTIESLWPMGEGLIPLYVQFFKGNLLALSDDEAEAHDAEAIFHSRLDHARKWQWKLPELHAAAGLARLISRTGRCPEARAMLAIPMVDSPKASTRSLCEMRRLCSTT